MPIWDDRSFYDFVATVGRLRQPRPSAICEVFGQVGFGTGGWDTDFPNSMLEILRVVVTNCDEDQRLIVGGVEQLPRRLWRHAAGARWRTGRRAPRWRRCTTARRAPASRASRPHRRWSASPSPTAGATTREYPAVLVTCQSWLLTTHIDVDEALFSQKLWMALDRTRYMQSSKTFVMVDRPFWKDSDPTTGRDVMSMTLTDRLTRGTYLFDNGPDQPGVICLSYSWMGDALKLLPLPIDKRVELMLNAPEEGLSRARHRAATSSATRSRSPGRATRNFLGAFKGALPGHYRYNHRMYCHFMQDDLPPHERGIFIAGDDVSWTPGWVEGAVTTGLNAVWGILHHLGGAYADGKSRPRRPLRGADAGGAAGLSSWRARSYLPPRLSDSAIACDVPSRAQSVASITHYCPKGNRFAP